MYWHVKIIIRINETWLSNQYIRSTHVMNDTWCKCCWWGLWRYCRRWTWWGKWRYCRRLNSCSRYVQHVFLLYHRKFLFWIFFHTIYGTVSQVTLNESPNDTVFVSIMKRASKARAPLLEWGKPARLTKRIYIIFL